MEPITIDLGLRKVTLHVGKGGLLGVVGTPKSEALPLPEGYPDIAIYVPGGGTFTWPADQEQWVITQEQPPKEPKKGAKK